VTVTLIENRFNFIK